MEYLEEALQRQQRLIFTTIYHQGLYLPEAPQLVLAAVWSMCVPKFPFSHLSVLRREP